MIKTSSSMERRGDMFDVRVFGEIGSVVCVRLRIIHRIEVPASISVCHEHKSGAFLIIRISYTSGTVFANLRDIKKDERRSGSEG